MKVILVTVTFDLCQLCYVSYKCNYWMSIAHDENPKNILIFVLYKNIIYGYLLTHGDLKLISVLNICCCIPQFLHHCFSIKIRTEDIKM